MELEYMKSVRFIGILIILLLTVGTAGADVVLTKDLQNGSILVSVSNNADNSTITFLDQSTEVNNPGIAGIAYNLNVDAQLITGYKKNSNTGQILFNGNSDKKDGYVWKKINNSDTSGESSNLLRFYLGDTGNTDRFQKVVVKLPNFDGNIPADSNGNQVGVQYLCDQFTGFIAGPIGGAGPVSVGTTNDNPAIDIEITALSKSFNAEGQKLQYGFVVSNTGNVAITELTVTDSKLGTISFPSNVLNPGQIVSVTTVYTVSKADIDAGSVTNTAYASGKYKSNIIQSNYATVNVKADNESSATDTASTGNDNYVLGNSNDVTAMVTGYNPDLTFNVSASADNYSTEGQKIEFDYFVMNTGNVPIKEVKVSDNYLGTVSILNNTSLEPNDSISATAIYTITQEDLDLGKVRSLSHATGTFNGNEIRSDVVNLEIKADTQIPEFPSIVLPVAAILGLLFLSQHKRKEN
jgi:hypothetical protein